MTTTIQKLAAAFTFAVLLVGGHAFAQEDPTGFAANVPVPPEQNQPWTPPSTTLPAAVVSATTALFEDGMADPRGCEYREVEIVLDGGTLKAHGWVLPADGKAPQYAIGWNGVIYPVKTVGPRVNIADDLAPAVRGRFFDGGWPLDDRRSLSTWAALRIQVALLLRVEQRPLAEALWRNGCAHDSVLAFTDPFPMMSASWLGPWYSHAVAAYLRGDYPLALAMCQRIAPAMAKALATARARGCWDPWPERKGGVTLWQLPILAAEAQRRIKEPAGDSVLDSGHPLEGPEHVAALIRELQQVRVQQWVNPGQTDTSEDPVVQALVKEGDAVVELLLKCLVEDNRLTRSQYTARMNSGGPIIPVYEAAYTALFGILNVSFPPVEQDSEDSRWQKEPRHLGPDDRHALAAKLEAVWRKNRGVDPLERAFAKLDDDSASPDDWFQALDDIVQPNDGTFTNYRLMPPAMGGWYSGHIGDGPFTPRGESLRGRSTPSVTELLIRRFEQLASGDPAKAEGGMARMKANQDLSKLGKLLLALADWDGKSHLDDLRRLEHALQAKFRQEGENVFDSGSVVLQLFEKRLELGDATALQDYADHIGGLTPKNLATNYGSPPECFRLMWRHPEEPVIVQTAEKMFAPDSPWVPLVMREQQNLAYLIRSPLVGLPAFRQELNRGLSDVSAAGEMTLAENGQLNEGNARLYTLDPLAPPKGTKITYRLCDDYAHELSHLDGFPRCELYWPTTERDRAVEVCRAFLARYGNNFRYQPEKDAGIDHAYPTATIHFPVLDHAATPEDVSAGRAIFSLPAPSRVCPLPKRPLVADRPGHQEDPCPSVSVAQDGTSTSTVSYTTRGVAWQAEETLVNGKWERYYGFVGRYQLEKVPAAEIEFPWAHAGGNVTPEISGSIEAVSDRPAARLFREFASPDFVSPASAVPIRVVVANHGGLDQIVPGAVLPAPGASRTLPPGIGFSLSYSGKVPPRVQRFAEPPFDYGVWQETPMRGEVQVAGGDAAGPALGPAQELTVMDIELRDYFDLSRVGSYRLRAIFRAPGQTESQSNEIIFSVAAGDTPRP